MANQVIYTETQLTAAGTTTVRTVMAYKHFTVQYTVASIDTSIDVRAEGSLDGVNWFNLDEQGDTTVSANGTYALRLANVLLSKIRFNFVSETGGTGATVDVVIGATE